MECAPEVSVVRFARGVFTPLKWGFCYSFVTWNWERNRGENVLKPANNPFRGRFRKR